MLRRRWWLVLLCVVVASAAAFGFSVAQQKQYTASSQLLFQNTNFSQQLFGSNFVNPSLDPVSEQATNLSLASLPAVADRTASALHLPAGLVSSEVSVSSVGQSNLATVSATDPLPRRAAKIANAYARQYVLFREHDDRVAIVAALRQVNGQLARLTSGELAGALGQQLQTRANDLQVLASLQTGDAQVAQTASVPTSPSSPKTKRNAALGALLGLLLGLGLAFLLQRLDRRVREPDELQEIYGVPLLASVPDSRALAAKRVALLPTSELDSVGLLRSRLRYFNVDRDLRSLLITSATAGEGKSTVAINLAIVEAMSGDRSVLLFDADLRRPSAARRLGLSSTPGTSEILSGNASLDRSLVWVDVPHRNGNHQANLAVLPSGAIPPNPIELLSSHALIELLNELVQRFDLVIIDSPPLTLVPDAIPVVHCVSGVLVVARIGFVIRSAARHAAEQLENLKAPTLGVVANAMPRRDQAYYYGDSYGYKGKGMAGNAGRAPIHASSRMPGQAARYPEPDWTEATIDPD